MIPTRVSRWPMESCCYQISPGWECKMPQSNGTSCSQEKLQTNRKNDASRLGRRGIKHLSSYGVYKWCRIKRILRISYFSFLYPFVLRGKSMSEELSNSSLQAMTTQTVNEVTEQSQPDASPGED